MSKDKLRIYFRALEPDDYLFIHELRKDDDNWEQTTGNRYYVSSQREKKWVEDKIMDDSKEVFWAVCLKEDNTMIGYCGISEIDWRNKSCLWASLVISKEHRGKKYANEAGFLTQYYVFSELGLHRLHAPVRESYTMSRKWLKTLGFREDGVIRDGLFKRNKFHNLIQVSILKPEYEENGLKYLIEKGYHIET
jgi:RimJ/RimL family protein N-acetyltransferase